jgi:hypothetical protein
MHDGGVSVETIVNGKPVCTSEAIYGTKLKLENGKEWTTISKMTDCDKPFSVKNGDMITLKVSYDEINHPRRVSNPRFPCIALISTQARFPWRGTGRNGFHVFYLCSVVNAETSLKMK